MRVHLLVKSLFVPLTLALPFPCPIGTGLLSPPFLGSATSPSTSLQTTPTALFLTQAGDTIGTYSCILHTFTNPNAEKEVFITIGSERNPPADQDVTCAFLSLTAAPAVIFNLSDPSGAACPIKGGSPFSGWSPSPPAPALPACPSRSVAVPASLAGQGKLADPSQSGQSFLLLQGAAWTVVEQGALVDVSCVAAVSNPPGQPAALVQLEFSNSESGAVAGCAWALPHRPDALQYKLGKGRACPTDFNGASTIPFKYNATV